LDYYLLINNTVSTGLLRIICGTTQTCDKLLFNPFVPIVFGADKN